MKFNNQIYFNILTMIVLSFKHIYFTDKFVLYCLGLMMSLFALSFANLFWVKRIHFKKIKFTPQSIHEKCLKYQHLIKKYLKILIPPSFLTIHSPYFPPPYKQQ